jgi:two-component system cell cycle sensor histidine kinase/response regulator CckA
VASDTDIPDALRLLQVRSSAPDAAALVDLVCQSGVAVQSMRVEDARAFEQALASQPWDVVISDFALLGFDALAALERLQFSGRDLPFIVIPSPGASQAAVDDAVAVMRAGAHHYLPFDQIAQLPSVITRELRAARQRRRKRDVAQELKEAQERLTLALDATKLGIIDYYPQTRILVLTPSFREVYDIPPGVRASPRMFLRRIHPDDRKKALQNIRAASRPGSGGSLAIEHRLTGAEAGENRQIITWGTVFFDEAGRPFRFLGVARDITERKRASNALQYQSQLTQCITQQSADSIFVIGPEGLTSFVNTEAERAFGFTAAELIGKSLHDMLHHHYPDGRLFPASECHAAQAVNDGQTRHDEESILFHKDGTPVDVSCARAPLEVNGLRAGTVITVRDIRGRKQAENALRDSEARFRRLTEAGIVGIVIADTERIVEANDHFVAMLGYTREEFTARGLSWLEITAPEFRESSGLRRLALVESGSCPAYEKMLLRKDGALLPVLTAGVAIPYAGHRCFFAFTIDLSGRRNLEEQLRQVQKLDSIGQLAGGIAHDFNNLLTIILGYANLLSREVAMGQTPGPQMLARIDGIVKSASRASDLTRQLLTFSRQQRSDPKIVSLDRIVLDVEQLLHRLIGEDIGIVLALDAAESFIRADPGQIEQVVMNLALNARDAMPEGGKLCIETSNLVVDEQFAALCLSVPPGPYVQLTVSDTGSGMSSDIAAHVFEPFFTTKEPGKGTGLGLSTAYGIIRQSGGTISVHSAPGLGATFRILLPRAEGAHVNEQGAPDEPVTSGTETILVVEDEAGVREYVREVLTTNGYRVLEAGNRSEAMARVRRHNGTVDLLLTDYVLPDGGGEEVVREIARSYPGIKVLMMSGFTDRVGRRLNKSTPLLQKPFASAELLKLTRRVLDAKPAETPM